MAIATLPQGQALDGSGIELLLANKLRQISETEPDGIPDIPGGAALHCFLDEFNDFDAVVDDGPYAQAMFSEGVQFGIRAVLAVLANPFGDSTGLCSEIEQSKAYLRDIIKDACTGRDRLAGTVNNAALPSDPLTRCEDLMAKLGDAVSVIAQRRGISEMT